MKGERQRAIAEFFGEKAQMGEDGKFEEELQEIIGAYLDYRENPSKDTLEHLLNELGDATNVAEGVYRQLGGDLDKISIEKEYKLDRAISIINRINPWENDKMAAYNKIRYEEESC